MSYFNISTPPSIPGLLCWLDSTVQSSIISSGGAISQWSDISGRGYNFTQSTGANKPALTSNNIVFNGSTSYLSNSSITSNLSHINSDFSIYVAFQTTNYTINDQTIMSNAISGNSDEWVMQIRFNEVTSGVWHGSLDQSDSSAFTSNSINTMTILHENSSFGVETFLNYSPTDGTNAPSVAISGTNCCIGCLPTVAGFFNGIIQEVIIFEQYLSASNNVLIQRYLSNKYGSPTS